MLTRRRARQAGDQSRPTSSSVGGSSVLKGIVRKTVGRNVGAPCDSTCGQILQPEWTGPVTRSRAAQLNARVQNLLLERGRPGGFSMEPAPSTSAISISSGRSCSLGSSNLSPASIPGPSSRSDCSTQPSTKPSPLQRMNILETLVKTFPLTVPEEEVCNFLDSRGQSAFTADLKRYIIERKNQQRSVEKNVSVFRAARPWEPKWFTDFLTKLILSAKPRPSIYQYLFDARQSEQARQNTLLVKWNSLCGFARYTIGAAAVFAFLLALCIFIDTYGEEAVNLSVPLILFVNIIINKVLINMSGALPDDI